MQRDFARLYVLNGGVGRHAALEAGYSPHTVDRAAQKCLSSRLVLAEIKRLSVINIDAKLPDLIRRLFVMLDDDATSPDVKARIIFNLMDRGAMPKAPRGPAVQVNVKVNDGGATSLIQEIWDSRAARERAITGILSSHAFQDNDAHTEGRGR